MSELNPFKQRKKKKKTKAYEYLSILSEKKLKGLKELKKGAKISIAPGNFRLKGKNGEVLDVADPKSGPEDILVKVKIDNSDVVELGVEEIEGLEDLV